MEVYGGREGIEGLHCGLHSDYVVSRESFWSPLMYTQRESFFNACQHIQEPGVFQRMRDFLRRRAVECFAMNGGHVEHLL